MNEWPDEYKAGMCILLQRPPIQKPISAYGGLERRDAAARQLRTAILTLTLKRCGVPSKSFIFLDLSFLVSKMGIMDLLWGLNEIT